MRTPLTEAQLRERLHEHAALKYPSLGHYGLYPDLNATFYNNGDVIRFAVVIDNGIRGYALGEVLNKGAIKKDRRWLITGNTAAYTGTELKSYLRLAGLGWVNVR